jgi:hypothetical protein
LAEFGHKDLTHGRLSAGHEFSSRKIKLSRKDLQCEASLTVTHREHFDNMSSSSAIFRLSMEMFKRKSADKRIGDDTPTHII